MDAVDTPLLHFEGFTLDLSRRRLLADGDEIRLRPKSFDVLGYLAERQGRLVTKDEIIGAVWPNVVATDDSLARCVSDIRQVLGDSGRQIVRTVPGRGYVFASPTSTGAGAGPPPDLTAPARPGAARPDRRLMRAATGVILLAAIVLSVAAWSFDWFSGQTSALPLPDRPSIVVLPFRNMSGDAGQDHVSDGISQDLTTSLSRFGDLFVIAYNSASMFRGREASTSEIARELGVGFVLQGSVRGEAGRMRITVQLIDARSGAQIWAENYDRETDGIFSVQDDIIRQIVVRLVTRINHAELRRISRRPAAVWAAHDHTLRGNAIMRAAPRDRSGAVVAAARAAYEQALAIDPDHAPALQGLALTYWTAWLKPLTDEPLSREFSQQANLDRARELAQRAVDLDPTRAGSWATLGWILHWQRGPGAAAGVFERAFELNPNFVDGRFALVLAHAGHAAEAIEYMERAMRLDPLYPLRYEYYLGLSYFLAGRDEEAVEPLRAAAHGLPGFPTGFPLLATIAALTGRIDEARGAAAEVLRARPGFTTSGFVRFMRLARQQDADRLTEGLRGAGLPE